MLSIDQHPGCPQPFFERLVFVGDCGESRLYKDGIGGAYRTAKAAAKTAVFERVSAEDFRRQYDPVCKALARDNAIGKVIFRITRLIQALRWARRGCCAWWRRNSSHGARRGA